jgi:hypothetical protein
MFKLATALLKEATLELGKNPSQRHDITISPSEIRNITVAIPYLNSRGVRHTLTVTLGLKYTIGSSARMQR